MYMMAWGNCINCKGFMGYNPDKVPSLRIEGEREPLCEACFNEWNQIHRIRKGLKPIPLNKEAYTPQEC